LSYKPSFVGHAPLNNLNNQQSMGYTQGTQGDYQLNVYSNEDNEDDQNFVFISPLFKDMFNQFASSNNKKIKYRGIVPSASAQSLTNSLSDPGYCPAAELISPGTDPSYSQWLSNTNGQYIVWEQVYYTIKEIAGYDLGSDLEYGTPDDGGIKIIAITDNSLLTSNLGGPNVNAQGLVVFVRSSFLISSPVELVVCQFSDCSNTLTVIDTIPLLGGWLPSGQFIDFDINDRKVIYSKNTFGVSSEVVLYDLTSGARTPLERGPPPVFPYHIDTYFNPSFGGENSLISWVKSFGRYDYDWMMNYVVYDPPTLPDPLVVVTQPYCQRFNPDLFTFGCANDMAAYKQGQQIFIVYPAWDIPNEDYELAYKIYDGSLSPPYSLVNDEYSDYPVIFQHQRIPDIASRSSTPPNSLPFVVAMVVGILKYDNYPDFFLDSNSYVQSMVYSSQKRKFVPYKIFTTDSGSFSRPQVGSKVMIGEDWGIIGLNGNSRIVISSC